MNPRWILLCMMLLCLAPATQVRAQETSHEFEMRVSPADRLPNMPVLIKGTVRALDRDTPLAYTNVFLEGTTIGTMAVTGGQFWLRGLAPGTYTIKASYISYSVEEVTVTVEPGDIVHVDFWLARKPVEFDPFLVRAERRSIILEETGTARRLGSDQIEDLPVDDVVELVGLQAGVSLEGNEIHIRGGRSDDTQYFVDGLSAKDPLAAGRYGVSFNADLISEIEVLTGGFSAEYGQAVSGVVNVSTKEGNDDFEGKVTYKTDSASPEAAYFNTDNMRLTFSGPNLLWDGMKAAGVPLPGEQYFIVSGSADLSDTYLPTDSLNGEIRSPVIRDDFWSPRADNSWSGLAKLTWKFDPTRKFNLTHSNQQDVSLGYFLASEGYPNKFQNILDNYNVFTSQNILTQAVWNHVLGEDRFYELVVGRQFSRLHSNKNGNDDFSTYSGPDFQRTILGENAVEIEGAHIGGDSDRWHDHYTETWTVKGDYTWMAKDINQLKAGVEYNWTEMQLVDLNGDLGTPPPGFLARSQDVFFASPMLASGYLQDRITYKGLILNTGMRLDGWAPGREVDDIISRPDEYVFIFDETRDSYNDKTYDVFGRRWKARLSPRIGLSFPVSPRDKFFFNYGHFSQWPRYNYVYAQLQTDFATDLQLVGNPDLDPKVTVQYETGIQHEFNDLWSAELTFYSNDIYGYAKSVKLEAFTIDPADTPDPNDETAVTADPVRYFNADAARTIGIEATLTKRTTRWLSGSVTGELQRSSGTNSDADANFVAAQLGQGNSDLQSEDSIRTVPLLWDRPWSLTFNMDFTVDAGTAPKLFGWSLPKKWGANLLYRAWSGQRYTTVFLQDAGTVVSSPDRNGELGPYRSSLDLKFRKWVDLPAGQRFTLFFEGRNLLNHGNYRRVNPWTGQGYHAGNWDGAVAAARANGSGRDVRSRFYSEDVVNPSNLTEPRMIFMGASYKW